MKETFKAIPGYEGVYEISNLGRVKSLARLSKDGRQLKERMLTAIKLSDGYTMYRMMDKGYFGHKLMAMTYLNHNISSRMIVVNHKNFDRADNRLENLEIITQRENANRKHLPSSSKYVGVSYDKLRSKWHAYITIEGKRKHLGFHSKELEAHKAYQVELNKHNKNAKR